MFTRAKNKTIVVSLALAMLVAGKVSARDGDQAKRIEVPDANGKVHRPLEISKGRKASCLIFVLHDCPIANHYSREMQRIQRDFEPKGVVFYLVYPDPAIEEETVRRHVSEFRHTAIPLLDRKQVLVRKTGATITPEAAVILPGGRIAYRGRIDDLYAALGVRRPEPTRRDLRQALQAVSAGRKPSPERTTAVGCNIPPLD